MSLLKKASIITTPTAYAEDYLYSIKPAYAINEVVVNGTFDTDSDWTKTAGVTISNGKATIVVTGGGFEFIGQSISYDLGAKYRVKLTVQGLSGSSGKNIRFQDNASNLGTLFQIKTLDETVQTFEAEWTPNSVSNTIHIARSDTGDYSFTVDNVSVKKITEADFDFDRNSTGTRVNEDYLIEDVPYNLVLHSQSFSSGWFNTNSTETLDTSVLAPDGTATAWKLQANAGTHFSFLGQTVTMSGQISFSVFLKKGTATTASVFLSESGNFGLTANLENGTITSVTGSDMVGSVESAGNGWYRFEIKHTSGDDLTNTVRIGVEGGSFGSVTYAGTENIYIWGAQITKGDIKPYLKTTDRLDIPRIDYTNGEPSILLEPSRQNRTKYSQDFSNVYWVKTGASISSSTGLSPESLQNSKIIESTAGTAFISDNTVSLTIGNTYTFSVFVKKINATFIRLGHQSSTATGCWFDLDKGEVKTVNSTSATIQKFPNGWYRITNTFNATISSGGSLAFIGICDADGSTSAPTGFKYEIYGAQVEEASYETSLIHTSGSAVTRSADSANNAGNSDLINSTEGVLYAEIKANSNDESGRQITINDGTSNNTVQLKYTTNDNRIDGVVKSGNVNQSNMNYTVSTVLEYHKVAVKYKENDFALWIDGKEVNTDSSGITPIGLNELDFNNGGTSQGSPFLGNCKMVAVFKEALTDLELAKLTGYNNHELYMNYYNRLSYLGLVEEYNVESDINNYIL